MAEDRKDDQRRRETGEGKGLGKGKGKGGRGREERKEKKNNNHLPKQPVLKTQILRVKVSRAGRWVKVCRSEGGQRHFVRFRTSCHIESFLNLFKLSTNIFRNLLSECFPQWFCCGRCCDGFRCKWRLARRFARSEGYPRCNLLIGKFQRCLG